MKIVLPKTLKQFAHDDIVRLLKRLNSRFSQAHRASWPQATPDLEEPVTREVVEVAVSRDLKTSWGQCLYYHRMGASQIHLVLSPRLFIAYKKSECSFVRDNPIPNVIVYVLPDIRLHVSDESKIKTPKKTKIVKIPMLNFVTSDKEMREIPIPRRTASKTENQKEVQIEFDDIDNQQKKLRKSAKENIEYYNLVPVLTPLGHVSYITKASYEKEKEIDGSKINFWRPLRK